MSFEFFVDLNYGFTFSMNRSNVHALAGYSQVTWDESEFEEYGNDYLREIMDYVIEQMEAICTYTSIEEYASMIGSETPIYLVCIVELSKGFASGDRNELAPTLLPTVSEIDEPETFRELVGILEPRPGDIGWLISSYIG